jgi:hypothetical protein
MTFHRPFAVVAALLVGLGGASLLTGEFGQSGGNLLVASAHAQSRLAI